MENNDVRTMIEPQAAAIKDFIQSKDSTLKDGFFNKVLRDDIFRLLENQDCVVVYYPLEDEENNGFHVAHPLCGELKHFVYINTAQLKETQIFTAAHELGHIWELVKFLNSKGFSKDDANWEERVISRFAAELLMPEDAFKFVYSREFEMEKRTIPKPHITIIGLIRIITALMNEFLTPFKSVVYRLYELRIITDATVAYFLQNYDEGSYKSYSKIVAKEQGYSRLYKEPDHLKHIDGLKELLDKARDENTMPEKWLDSMYTKFEFERNCQERALETSLLDGIGIHEEGDVDAKDSGN